MMWSKVVKTPELFLKEGYVYETRSGVEYVYLDDLSEAFELPEQIASIWVEMSTHQFTDRSGLACRAMFVEDYWGAKLVFESIDEIEELGLKWRADFHIAMELLLKRLGVCRDEWTQVYVRVLFKEK